MTRRGRVWLDFETFSRIVIKKAGPSRYVEDESTVPICLGYSIDDGPVKVWVDEKFLVLPEWFENVSLTEIVRGSNIPADLRAAIESGYDVWAHNAEFDLCVWDRFYSSSCPIVISQWRDAMSLAAMYALPLSLDGATSARKQEHLKDSRGKYLINQLCKPKKPTKKNPSTRRMPDEFPVLFDDLFRYCAADVEAMRELVDGLPENSLDDFEQSLWALTVVGNLRGLPVDVREVKKMKREIVEFEAKCLEEIKNLTGGQVKTGNQRDKIIAWCGTRGVKIKNTQQKTIDDLLKKGELPADVDRLFKVRRQVGRVSTKKYDAILERVCKDGTVKNNLVYWGAGPGRFAGRGFQVQNLPRLSMVKEDDAADRAFRSLDFGHESVELLYDDFMTFASGMIRSTIKAPDGYEFLSGDYSSIENRLTLWCGGETDGLEKFRLGMDQYKDFASKRHGVAYADVTYQQRVDAKAFVLGCGFGMGWEKFMKTSESKGTIVSEQEARDGVQAFRDIYPGVPKFWYGCADAAKAAVKKPNTTHKYKCKYMELAFRAEDGWLKMRLPSGRFIRYYRPRLELRPAPWDKSTNLETITHMGLTLKKQWARITLIPGRIAENAVQGIGRDIMAIGMLKAEALGYPVLTTIHDEVLSMVKAGWGSIEEFCLIICPDLPWLKDFPLVAEGWRGRRYRK